MLLLNSLRNKERFVCSLKSEFIKTTLFLIICNFRIIA